MAMAMIMATAMAESRVRREHRSRVALTKGSRGGIALRRLLISVAAISIAAVAASHALASIAADRVPAMALSFVPGHPAAAAGMARSALVRGEPERAETAALVAIRNSAISSDAFQTLGLIRANKDADEAKRLFEYAVALNQREAGAQMWLARDLFIDGEWESSLRHLDAAMRVSPASHPTGYRLLAFAIAADEMADPVLRILRGNPSWLDGFLAYGVQSQTLLPSLARVVMQLPNSSPARSEQVEAALLSGLVNAGEYEQARGLIAKIGPSNGSPVRDSSFILNGPYQPFDWKYLSDPGKGAAPTRTESGGLRYQANTGEGGPIATQLIMLEPGTYELKSLQRTQPTALDGYPYWTLACAGDNQRQLADLRIPRGDDKAARPSSTQFDVPARGCQAQWLQLNIRATFSPGGLEGEIARVWIEPATGRPS